MTAAPPYPNQAGYPDRLKKKKKPSPAKKLLLAGLLGSGAYGSYRASDWILPEESVSAIQDAEETYDRLMRTKALTGIDAVVDPAISEYGRVGSRLANAKVMGVPGAEFVKGVRDNLSFLPGIEPWKGYFSDAHYDAFRRGQAYGVAQGLDEHAAAIVGDKNYPKDRRQFFAKDFTPKFEKKLNLVSQDWAGKNLTGGPFSLRQSLATGKSDINPWAQARITDDILKGEVFTDDNSFNPFKPDFSKNYDYLKGSYAKSVLGHSFPGYINLASKARTLRDTTRKTIPLILGLTAAGVGGVGIYQLMKTIRKKKEEREARAEEARGRHNEEEEA